MARQAPSWAILAPSWPHLGAKFGHLAAILGIPRLSKIGQNRPRQPASRFSCQDRFQDLPDPLQTSIFTVFGPILGHTFNNFLKTFWKDSVSNFKASHKISLGISSEAGGGGTRPQGVFDIRRPRVAVSRACLSRVSNPANSNFPTLPIGSRGVLRPLPVAPAACIPRAVQKLFPLKLAILAHLRSS